LPTRLTRNSDSAKVRDTAARTGLLRLNRTLTSCHRASCAANSRSRSLHRAARPGRSIPRSRRSNFHVLAARNASSHRHRACARDSPREQQSPTSSKTLAATSARYQWPVPLFSVCRQEPRATRTNSPHLVRGLLRRSKSIRRATRGGLSLNPASARGSASGTPSNSLVASPTLARLSLPRPHFESAAVTGPSTPLARRPRLRGWRRTILSHISAATASSLNYRPPPGKKIRVGGESGRPLENKRSPSSSLSMRHSPLDASATSRTLDGVGGDTRKCLDRSPRAAVHAAQALHYE